MTGPYMRHMFLWIAPHCLPLAADAMSGTKGDVWVYSIPGCPRNDKDCWALGRLPMSTGMRLC